MGKSSSICTGPGITSSKAGGPLPLSTKLPCAGIVLGPAAGKDIRYDGARVLLCWLRYQRLMGWAATWCSEETRLCGLAMCFRRRPVQGRTPNLVLPHGLFLTEHWNFRVLDGSEQGDVRQLSSCEGPPRWKKDTVIKQSRTTIRIGGFYQQAWMVQGLGSRRVEQADRVQIPSCAPQMRSVHAQVPLPALFHRPGPSCRAVARVATRPVRSGTYSIE